MFLVKGLKICGIGLEEGVSINPAYVYIFRNLRNMLCYKNLKNKKIYEGISINLLFPLTNRKTFIQLLDYNKRELCLIKNLTDLDDQSKKILNEELERIYFIPKITKIHSIDTKFGIIRWKVDIEK